MGFEPTTFSLARKHSTPELHPHNPSFTAGTFPALFREGDGTLAYVGSHPAPDAFDFTAKSIHRCSAEGMGFEPTRDFSPLPFQDSAINHSATLPKFCYCPPVSSVTACPPLLPFVHSEDLYRHTYSPSLANSGFCLSYHQISTCKVGCPLRVRTCIF